MSRRDRGAWRSHDDSMVHLVNHELPLLALCGADIRHPPGARDERPASDADCMTCLVRASRPSLANRVAAALGVPKEFLYGESENDGADDR